MINANTLGAYDIIVRMKKINRSIEQIEEGLQNRTIVDFEKGLTKLSELRKQLADTSCELETVDMTKDDHSELAILANDTRYEDFNEDPESEINRILYKIDK